MLTDAATSYFLSHICFYYYMMPFTHIIFVGFLQIEVVTNQLKKFPSFLLNEDVSITLNFLHSISAYLN